MNILMNNQCQNVYFFFFNLFILFNLFLLQFFRFLKSFSFFPFSFSSSLIYIYCKYTLGLQELIHWYRKSNESETEGKNHSVNKYKYV